MSGNRKIIEEVVVEILDEEDEDDEERNKDEFYYPKTPIITTKKELLEASRYAKQCHLIFGVMFLTDDIPSKNMMQYYKEKMFEKIDDGIRYQFYFIFLIEKDEEKIEQWKEYFQLKFEPPECLFFWEGTERYRCSKFDASTLYDVTEIIHPKRNEQESYPQYYKKQKLIQKIKDCQEKYPNTVPIIELVLEILNFKMDD